MTGAGLGERKIGAGQTFVSVLVLELAWWLCLCGPEGEQGGAGCLGWHFRRYAEEGGNRLIGRKTGFRGCQTGGARQYQLAEGLESDEGRCT
jgi:hypothetical protein